MDKFLPAGDTYDLSIGSPLLARDEESKPSYAGVVGATLRESPMTPDQAKKTVDLSRQTGLDSGFVARNMADVESMVEEQGLEEMLSDSTGLATWMSTDAIRATMGKADLENLVETSKLFFSDLGKVGSFASDAAQRRMTYDSMLFQRDVEQKGQSQDIDAERMISMLARQLPKDAQKLAQDYGLTEQFVINTMEQFPVQMEILKSRVAGAGAGAATGALIGAGAGGAGAVPGAWAGAKWGGAVASMYTAYNMEVEGAYSQMVGEGVPSEVASIASRIYGGLASVVEFGDALFDWKLMGADKIAATPGKAAVKMTVRNAIKDFAMAFVKGKGVETAEEMTQQGLQLAVTEAAKMYSNVESGMTMEKAAEEVLTAGVKTFWSLWGAESAAPSFAVNLYDAKYRGGGRAYLWDKAMLDGQQREQEILNALTDAAQMSKLAQLDYVLYQEAVQAMANGSDVTTVYIPVNGFVEAMGGSESMSENSAMSERIDAILGALGLTRDDLAIAMETGGDLIVPVANYAATVAQDREFATLIANHRRLTPDGYTVREMDEYTESVKVNLQNVLAEAAAEDAELSQRDAEAKEIYWAVKSMREAVGANSELAAADAAQVTAFFATVAARARTTPRALWDAFAPDMRFGEDGKIVQASEALFPAGDNSAVTDEDGLGEPLMQAAKRTIYSDDRSVKMVFEDTGVEPSFEDRGQLRAYLESLRGRDLRKLKAEDEGEYLSMLKSIVRKFFTSKGGLRFRKGEDGKQYDYEHFIGRDSVRDEYLASLPTTLKDQDITVEFADEEGRAKAYLISKYIDSDTLKDVWDLLVIRDAELITKIARGHRKGRGTVESYIEGARRPVSAHTSTEGTTESTSTPDSENASIIGESAPLGKTSQQMQEALERDSAGPDVSDPVAGPPTFYQWQNLPEWEEKISNWMREDGRSEEEIREYVDAIRGQMTIFEALGGQIERQVVGAGVAKSSKNKGYALGGPVRSNADQLYRISFDASSQCVKRLSAAATAKMVQDRLGRALTLDEQTVLVALYREKGLEAPCLYCYVESGRNKAIRMMETALKNMASAHIPTRLSATRKEGLRAAIDEMAANGLSVEDIDYNFVLNPIAGATEAAVKAKEQYPAIYGFLQSTMSDAKANSVKLYEEYKGELLDLAPEAVETLNGYAGVRFFSSSDFQVEHVIDLMQAMWDLKAMDAKAHAYTKVPLFVDIFGATGLKINTSIFAKLDKDGNVVPDTSQGWEWEEAQKRRELYPDVGAVLVAANDKILQWGLAQDWIDYIIPFHTSQLDAKIVASEGYQDFSSTQNERPIYRGQPAPKIRMHEMGTIEGLTDEQGTRNYLELCLERKVYPVFPAFLFKDFELTDPADPKARAKQTRKAKARWKAMVEKGEIDWDAINMNFFRLKKDYARTDTPFRVVEPEAINAEAARLPLQETLDKGLDAKYAGDAEIADTLVDIINGQGKAPSPTIGVDALSANRRGMSVAEATGRRTLEQRAWHGTPHNFDAFTLQAIGSGEGAQAHGWGLYFAEDQDVSERYRQVLLSGQRTSALSPYMWFDEVREYVDGNASLDDTVQALKEFIQEVEQEDLSLLEEDEAEVYAQELEAARESLRIIEESPSPDEEFVNKHRGQLFEVEIPDNDVLLDEQKKFSEQPDKVKQAIIKLLEDHPEINFTDEDGNDRLFLIRDMNWYNGAGIYKLIANRLSYSNDVQNQWEAASKLLNEYGIKGITYDGRSDGRCFVVFDDQAIEVVDKYYQGQGGPLGSFSPAYGSSRPLITLFEQADESTFLHESGHMYLEMLRSLAMAPSATEEVRAMWEEAKAVLNAHLGGEVVTDMAIPTEAHEVWASSLENWFMKGEAPSMELRGVFAKFSAWLKTIYTMLRSLGKTPAPALEPLFQRLFATDEQIAEVEAWHQRKEDWSELAEEETAKRLREAKAKAHDEAVDKRLQTLVKSYIQVLGGSKRFWQEARAAVESLPVYAAMDEAVGDDGLDYETVVALVGQEDASKLRKKRVGLFKKDGGDPSILAARHGFSDVYAMLGTMLEATPKTKAIKEHYETSIKAMTEKVARGVQEIEAMPGDAEYHNAAQLAVLVAERNLLNNKRLGDKARRDSMIEAEAILAAAREALSRLPVKKAIAAHSFSLAERKAGKLAWRLAMEKDWENAEKAKRQEAMAHAMYIAALEAREKVQKGIEKAKQATRSKSMQLQSKEMITDLGIRFGLMPYGGGTMVEQYNRWLEHAVRDSREYPNLTDWEKTALNNGYAVAIADWLKTTPPKSYKELTFEEMEDLLSAIEQIRKVDKRERTALVDGKRIELEKLAEQLEQAAQDAGVTPEKIDRFDDKKKRIDLKVLHAAHAKIEAILLNLDGWKHNGIWWTTFFKPIAEAEDAQTAMLRDVVAKMKALTPMLFKGVKEQYDFFNKRIYIPEAQVSMTMNQIVAVGLNMGNKDNIARVMVGENWNETKLAAVLSKMEKRHWDFCQGVWDYLETFRPASFALEREMSGRSPKAVEPQEVKTPFGTYRGGYYPIVYDSKHGDKAAEREQKDLDKQLFGGRNYGSAMTKHGHLKERSKGGTGEPLLLDVNVLSTHLYNTVHDLSHRKAVVEVAKILRNNGVYSVLKRYAGKPVAEQLMPWLQDISNEMQAYSGQNYVDRMAKWARHGTTVMQMGLKATTILVQPLGYALTAAYIGVKYAAIGLAEFHGNPLKSAEKAKFVFSKSEMMQNRAKGFDRDLREATKGLSLGDAFTRNVQLCAFSAIGWIQLGVDMPTWLGAYRKGLAENLGDEEKAVAYADSVVRMTQSSGSVKDLSRVQRGSELYRLMTMFYSAFNALYQLAWRAKRLTHGAKDIPFLAGQALMIWFLPSVLGELVAGRGPDEDEEWEKWMAKTIMMYPAQMFIGLRDLVNGFGPWGYQGTPAETAVTALIKFAKQVRKLLDAEEEVEPERFVKAGVEATGYFFGLPLKQPIITIGNIYDYMTGVTPDFQLRDLLFVKQADRR